jgi:superfamily II DNA/RNA helicase
MDQPDIRRVIQWKATCDMCTLWQRFGRAARNLVIDAEAILFVEPALTDAKKEAKETNRKKREAAKGKRTAHESWPQDRDEVLDEPDYADENTAKIVRANNSREGGQGDEAECRELYARPIKVETKKKEIAIEPAMDDFINAATRFGIKCYRVPARWLFEFDKASELTFIYGPNRG